MRRGSGFVHLNTPAAISYSPGQQVSLSDLRQKRRREECVVLPPIMTVWRSAFSQYTKMWGLTKFAGDIEAEREGEGPILPPIREETVVKSTTHSFKGKSTTVAAAVATPPGEKGIEIVSHHKLCGKQRFVYPDHDGVLSSGIVPKVVISKEEEEEMEANKKYYISPQEMTEEERNAFEELDAMWKSYARGRSEQGARHRAFAGTVTPGDAMTEVEEETGNNRGNARRRLESHTPRQHPQESAAEGNSVAHNTEEALDDALRLIDELLEFN
ncbi:nuclear cap binding complex subunit CBP30 [Trypanosoma equiperdum]|uniref:Nuclear cap binding complex subunit CBP30 n=4 Tax=Trypanozoon TaxID=39700 RepID=Q387Z0_TRYB2|nr:hypothetical protein, conserved [Trypanosoma brucei gambiense DAL972]XP_827994.1 hypothetical protein, conserved [Trypanosoma brucei brucei TREU927]RHW69516.1 nuclear cap binding complex subunit CBP30 [Trypanosoma brucei equiperdum]SCU66567.1 nuclear cap binding complex subunit CBP30 [Trypanosoma equiperdum]EAN78882.1 hypothetical protein, conserved [Trypanosoma brucei brucei TREU927]CBH16747.1 hypothetical protein, conserved [Trypanosoma brucei gambiense DAL972]|eukprot:XP_011779011.1 hypothetical protein, conserved [Trypanosoma brucei gambiense DAL972]